MSTTVRYILFILISLLIFQGWAVVESRLYPPKPHPTASKSSAQGPSGAVGTSGTTAPGAPGTVTPPVAGTAPGAPGGPTLAPGPALPPEELPGQSVVVSTSLWKAEFAMRGGALASFTLEGRKEEARARPGAEREGVNLATPDFGQPLPLATDLVLPGDFGVDAIYKVASKSDTELVLKRTRGGITVTKRFTWKPDSYSLQMQVQVEGAPSGTLAVKTYYTNYEPPEGERHFYTLSPRPDPRQAICYIKGERSVERRAASDHKPVETVPGAPQFAGVDLKYFLAALAPGSDPAPSTCAIGSALKEGVGNSGEVTAILERTLTVSAGAPATTTLELYLGPKEIDHLTAADHDFDKSVDLGFFGVIGRWIILPILKTFQKLVSNWGVAIIMLTILVKVATLPLTHHQMKSMEVSRRLQPEVEKIKKKYAGDQNRIQVETMKMYKENNHQPLAGCVPMLIQLPVWYALYATLGASFELYNEPFIKGWINDLTAIDPYYITPVLMTATMFLTQLLTPQAAPQPPEMKTVTYVMPVFFGFLMLTLPSGLVLYIFTNNLLSIGQSLWFRRKFAQAPVDAGDKK
jgi:YidC/Oxa1 family membrane protein insertase